MTTQNVSFSKKDFILRHKGKLSDRYEKIQELGYGSYSKVFKVQNLVTKQVYACKEILKSKVTNVERFKNEINVMSKVDHPNIVKIREIYEDQRYYQIVMEEIDGGSVFDRFIEKMEEKEETYTEKEAAILFKQIMSAINYCHKQGISHRDLKLENLLYVSKVKNAQVKMINFGFSAFFENIIPTLNDALKGEKGKMTEVVGTIHYMSPEVVEGKYTEKCDIWSAGVILYTILSGLLPFEGDSAKEVFKKILKKKYSFPEPEWTGISNEAKDLISKMLCEESKRYTAQMALDHPWIKNFAPNATAHLKNLNVKHLKLYRQLCGFKKMIINYIASRLNDKEIMELKSIFTDIDTNHDGTISLEEMKTALKQIKSKDIKEDEINDIFKGIDTDSSNQIEFTEFISASLEKSQYLKEERLSEIFNSIDKDHSGKISKKEVKEALHKEKISDNDIKIFIEKFDLDGDGEIDYNEFLSSMDDPKPKEQK